MLHPNCEFHRVFLLDMNVACKTCIFFIAEAFELKKLLVFLILISLNVGTQEFVDAICSKKAPFFIGKL